MTRSPRSTRPLFASCALANPARRALVALLAGSLTILSACSAADRLTGNTTDQSTSTGTSSGTITFWTSDSSPNNISVSVDGNVVGTLSAYRQSAPTCGATSTNGTLTVKVSAGSHTLSAHEIGANGKWDPSSMSVTAGGCITFQFNG